jgi:hypothetical protein
LYQIWCKWLMRTSPRIKSNFHNFRLNIFSSWWSSFRVACMIRRKCIDIGSLSFPLDSIFWMTAPSFWMLFWMLLINQCTIQ